MRARRSLIVGQRKIVEVEMEFDSVQALNDTLTGLQDISALPKADQESLRMQRERVELVLDEAYNLVELGRYAEANELQAEAVQLDRRLAAADPQDQRALADLNVSLIYSTRNYITEADPALGPSEGDRRQALMGAEKSLTEEMAVSGRLMKQEGGQKLWKSFLADAQVILGSVKFMLHRGGNSEELVKKGLATYQDLIKKNPASPTILDDAAQDFLYAEPASLKEPRLAVSCAERAVALTHRRVPSKLLTLAQAYRAAGQMERSRATAQEGLALLPPQQPGSVKPRIRKLLEALAQG
jgi:tetratricopeptide (TPR) repeat protein